MPDDLARRGSVSSRRGGQFFTRSRLQHVLDPIAAVDVGLLVDVVDPQPSPAGGPESRRSDSESAGECPQRVKFIGVDDAAREIIFSHGEYPRLMMRVTTQATGV